MTQQVAQVQIFFKLLGVLKTRQAVLLVITALALFLVAYQFFQPYRLVMGSIGDELFESGFYSREGEPQSPLRWTNGAASVSLPGIGNQPLRLSILLSGIRPSAPAHAKILVNGNLVGDFFPSGDMEVYEFPLDRNVVGGLGSVQVQIISDTFTPGADPRQLGLMIRWIQIEPLGTFSPTIPAPLQFIYFLSLVVISFLVLSILQPLKRWAFAISFMFAVLLSFGLIFYRVPLSGYGVWAAPLGVLSYLLVKTASSLKVWELIAIILLVISFGRFALASKALWEMGPQADFQAYYVGAQDFREGYGLYDFEQIKNDPLGSAYKYPPLLGLLLVPLVPLGLGTASDVWFLANEGLFLLSLALLVRSLELRMRSPQTYALLIGALNFQPVIETLLRGQIDIVFLFLVVLAWLGFSRGSKLVGASLAVATMLKIYPAFLLAFFVLKRQFRTVVVFAISCFLLVALSGTFTGWGPMWRYVTEVLIVPTPAVPSPENQSLNGFVSRLFIPGPGVQVGLAVPFPAWTLLLWVLLGAAILVATLWFIWRTPASDCLGIGLQFSAMFPLMLLLWPRSWIHYETLLLFPFAVLLVSLRNRQKADWLIAFGAVVSFLFLAFGDEDTVSGATLCCGVASLARSYKMYSIIVLWILCLVAAWRQKNSISDN